MRMYVTHNGLPFNLDIDMKNMQQPKYKRARKYEDKSIFKIKKEIIFEKRDLEDFLNKYDAKFAFAQEDVYSLCMLEYDNNDDCRYFKLYDVKLKEFQRKILKYEGDLSDGKSAKSQDLEEFEPFDIDYKANVLVYAFEDQLIFQSIRMPDLIQRHMAPKIQMAENKYSPARIQEVKHAMKEKINRDLRNYFILGSGQEYSNLA